MPPEATLTKEYDLYRDSMVRYLGYANEVGEAFRSIIGHKMVMGTYGVAIAYVLADTITKSRQEYERQKNYKKMMYVGADTVVWQMFASVIIPGITINRTCAFAFSRLHRLSPSIRKLTVAGIGLITIPIIITPIDHLVDITMDRTFRKIVSP